MIKFSSKYVWSQPVTNTNVTFVSIMCNAQDSLNLTNQVTYVQVSSFY